MLEYNLTHATEASSKTETFGGLSCRKTDKLGEGDISSMER